MGVNIACLAQKLILKSAFLTSPLPIFIVSIIVTTPDLITDFF